MGTLHSDQEQWDFVGQRASWMRMNPTPAERKARELLTRLGFKFQYRIKVHKHRSVASFKFYILDCYHEASKLCVELDGSVHRKTAGRDGRRDRALAMIGIRTMRFPNSMALKRPDEFSARVASAMRPIDTSKLEV